MYGIRHGRLHFEALRPRGTAARDLLGASRGLVRIVTIGLTTRVCSADARAKPVDRQLAAVARAPQCRLPVDRSNSASQLAMDAKADLWQRRDGSQACGDL